MGWNLSKVLSVYGLLNRYIKKPDQFCNNVVSQTYLIHQLFRKQSRVWKKWLHVNIIWPTFGQNSFCPVAQPSTSSIVTHFSSYKLFSMRLHTIKHLCMPKSILVIMVVRYMPITRKHKAAIDIAIVNRVSISCQTRPVNQFTKSCNLERFKNV